MKSDNPIPDLDLAIADQKETIRDIKRVIKLEKDPVMIKDYRSMLRRNKLQLSQLYRQRLKLNYAIFKASL